MFIVKTKGQPSFFLTKKRLHFRIVSIERHFVFTKLRDLQEIIETFVVLEGAELAILEM